jgi:hypothetical protein
LSLSARRLTALTPGEWRVVLEACLAAPLAAAAVRCFDLPRAARILEWLRAGRSFDSRLTPERAAALVDATLSRLSAQCLTKALVARHVLGRCGIGTDLVVGAARSEGQFRAHAWVERQGQVLIGAGERVYTPLWVLS